MVGALTGTSRAFYCKHQPGFEISVSFFLYSSQAECNTIQEWSFHKPSYENELTLFDTMGNMSSQAPLWF